MQEEATNCEYPNMHFNLFYFNFDLLKIFIFSFFKNMKNARYRDKKTLPAISP